MHGGRDTRRCVGGRAGGTRRRVVERPSGRIRARLRHTCWSAGRSCRRSPPKCHGSPSDRWSSTSPTGILEHWRSWRRRCSTSAVAASFWDWALALERVLPYAIEQEALGHRVPADPERRRAVERTIAVLRQVWSGTVPPAEGFLRPEPAPPIVVAAFGPKMAELAGRVGDGICVPAGPKLAELVAVARRARAQSGRDPEQFLVTASLPVGAPTRSSPGSNSALTV